MGLIFRTTKAGSTDGNYVPNVTILSAEVNEDFNQVYELVDGELDNSNIAANANIDASKLNLTNQITTGDLQDGAVTTVKIADGAVTLPKLALGVTVANNVVIPVPANTGVGTSEITLVDTPAFTSRGSPVLISGNASFICVLGGAPITTVNTLTVRLYTVNPTPVLLSSFDVRASWGTAGADTLNIPGTVSFAAVDSPTAGVAILYRVTVQASVQLTGPPSSHWQTVAGNAGILFAVQLA